MRRNRSRAPRGGGPPGGAAVAARRSTGARLAAVAQDGRLAAVAGLACASALCVAVDEYRTWRLGDSHYRFLEWNLFLAWVPLVLAAGAYACARRRLRLAAAGLALLWLLFFPNAPYMLTDFIHLQDDVSAAPVWYDALMLSSFAWTALLLGFASLYLMQVVWRRAAGPVWSWVGVVVVLALASFGVYIGRFIGYNSWDALLHPRALFDLVRGNVDNPLTHPRIAGALLVLTVALTIGYVLLTTVRRVRLDLDSPK